ncbi:uncharacterized protein LOC105379984 [Plutella xylostella]|uniref:uncharacterized protein LOC105379984 n=1 Tax=Plutella xylostella TaxID=51655 RepID=UPI0020329010|nr:uncharacterized protein LOC105379984 [Plutella xylostella]
MFITSSHIILPTKTKLISFWSLACIFYTGLLFITLLAVVYFQLRKRRSSILKSQRPPRTPFSELEFNVATPTDPGKSRRVSFSRRTGVAEFATNEATTTWKNFYEEQNRSLETSGQEAGQAPRPSVGHLGNRLFDQQFQEFEAEIDFGGSLGVPLSNNANTSFNVNVTEQLALLECTADDKKLTAPQNNFDLSSFTEHSNKVFRSDLTNPIVNEVSDRININFSNLNSIGGKMDDLDEIEKDLEFSNVVGPSFGDRRNVSQYIEFDLNGTQGPIRDNNESDMSITDTIHSPKNEVSKSSFQEIRKSTSKDWVEQDKENMILNPYVTPAEEDNFAVNVETEKVLVFDGKKVKYADINADLDELVETDKKPNKSLLNLPENNVEKTKIYEAHDDTADMSITKGIPANIENPKRRTIIFNDDDLHGDISMTQCISNVIVKSNASVVNNCDSSRPGINVETNKSLKSYADELLNDMSYTKVAPVSSIVQDINKKGSISSTKRQTIVFDEDFGDLSVTQCVSKNSVTNKTLITYGNENADMSVTQAIPVQIIATVTANDREPIKEAIQTDVIVHSESKTPKEPLILSDSKSLKQIFPKEINIEDNQPFKEDPGQNIESKKDDSTNHMLSTKTPQIDSSEWSKEKRRTIVFEDGNDISMTQAIPAQIIQSLSNADLTKSASDTNKRKTIVFNDSLGDISLTQSISAQIINKVTSESHVDIMEPENNTNKRKTIVFNDSTGDISMTQAIPAKIINIVEPKCNLDLTEAEIKTNKRKTIVFDDSMGDISMTQAIPAQIINNDESESQIDGTKTGSQTNKRKTLVFEDSLGDISMTQAIPAQILRNGDSDEQRDEADLITVSNATNQKTTMFEYTSGDISMTLAVPTEIMKEEAESDSSQPKVKDTNKHKTIVYDDDTSDISMNRSVPTNIISKFQTEINQTLKKENEIENNANNVRKTIVFADKMGDICMTVAIPSEMMESENVDTIPKEIDPDSQKRKSNVPTSMNQSVIVCHTMSAPYSGGRDEITSDGDSESNTNTEERKDNVETDAVSSSASENSVALASNKPQVIVNFNNESRIISTPEESEASIIKELPSSKGDEFHASSDKFFGKLSRLELNNPQGVPRANKSPKHVSKRLAEQAEASGEEKIQSISYDAFARSISKIGHDDMLCKSAVDHDADAINQDRVIASPGKLSALRKHSANAHTPSLTSDILKSINEGSGTTKELVKNHGIPSGKMDSSIKDESKKKILENLLDMRDDNAEADFDEKCVMTELPTVESYKSLGKKDPAVNVSVKSLKMEPYHLINTESNEVETIIPFIDTPRSEEKSPSTQRKDDEKFEDDLQKKLEELQSSRRKSYKGRHFEQVLSVDSHIAKCSLNQSDLVPECKQTGSVDDADDTKELLDMLSSLTDKTMKEERPQHSSTEYQVTIDKRSPIIEPIKKFSFAPEQVHSDNAKENKKRSGSHHSTDVIKTLNFDDEEPNKTSPMNKTPFVESVYIKDCDHAPALSALKKNFDEEETRRKDSKAKVIPNFDVSDGIKELMDDLVKPMADDLPFEAAPGPRVHQLPSTCSNQVQTNLVSSSQIDLDVEMQSPLKEILEPKRHTPKKSPIKSIMKQLSPKHSPKPQHIVIDEPELAEPLIDEVIIFDQNNPLNNILLLPADLSDAHKYDPKPTSNIHTDSEERGLSSAYSSKVEIGRVSIEFNLEVNSDMRSGDGSRKVSTVSDMGSCVKEVKDMEVNTVVAMKGTKELLDDDASLIIVEDDLCTGDTSRDSQVTLKNQDIKQAITLVDPDQTKARKRRHNRSNTANLNTPPKPVKKLQKLSFSPESKSMPKNSDLILDILPPKETVKKTSPKKHSPKQDAKSVPNLSTQESKVIEVDNFDDVVTAVEVCSSDGGKPVKDQEMLSISSREWADERSSSRSLVHSESGLSVVDKIDMLPFMGTSLCRWESLDPARWSFLLLHSRVRLSVVLARRGLAATPVRDDVPVTHVAYEAVKQEKPNTITSLAIHYALLRLRGHGPARAGAVPGTLRDAARVARLAADWARVMHDAQLRLAFSVHGDSVVMKVANIPLRSVWEVSIVISPSPCLAPRASSVSVRPVETSASVSETEAARAVHGVAEDWGHVPRTIWKIFRYLKHKRNEENLFMGL